MSNLLAGVGRRAQLDVLDERIVARRRNYDFYRAELCRAPGIELMPQAEWGHSNCWLSFVQIDAALFGADREAVRLHLENHNIESRPVWKPMHLQPVFAGCRVIGGAISERIFSQGLCLPSRSNLQLEDLERIVSVFLSTPRRRNSGAGG